MGEGGDGEKETGGRRGEVEEGRGGDGGRVVRFKDFEEKKKIKEREILRQRINKRMRKGKEEVIDKR